MILDIPLTRTADFANHHFLNQLAEDWHDEPYAMGLGAPSTLDGCAIAPASVREDSGRLAALESEASRPVGLALPMSCEAAA